MPARSIPGSCIRFPPTAAGRKNAVPGGPQLECTASQRWRHNRFLARIEMYGLTIKEQGTRQVGRPDVIALRGDRSSKAEKFVERPDDIIGCTAQRHAGAADELA